MRYRSLFGNGYNLVPDDPDLFLLHCYYHKGVDTLFMIFKRYSTGEKILWKQEEPLVPVFIAKNKPVRNLEAIEIRLCDRELVSYKHKSEEVKDMLFESKTQIFKDKYGRKVQRKIFPDVPKKAEILHPSLFLYDVSIEQIVYAEYAMNHYKHREDGSDLTFEDIKVPKINYAAFDIETSFWRDRNEWTINTNTFVDEQTMEAYIDVVKDYDNYNKQQYMLEHIPEFIQAVKDTYRKMVDECTLSGKTKDKVQSICREFIDKLDIKVRSFDSEADLIMETTKNMFTDHSPDILMAYNNTYDQGMFEMRRRALGLPEGIFNERGIGYDDVLPPYASDGNMNDDGTFRGEVAVPKKRRVILDNISHTMVQDLQTAYYSARQGSNYSNYKLNSLSSMVLGFGKYDYSHITNDILKLSHIDFWFHSIYALIDSINTLLINKVADEFGSKLIYCFMSKCPIEDTSQSNSTITRSFQTDYYAISNNVAGCNINKVLKNMSMEDVKKASKVIGVNFMPNWLNLHGDTSYGGGLVSNPNLYDFKWQDVKAANILSNEAHLTMLRKLRNLVYLDFKSHYPSTLIVRNISKSTLFGVIDSVFVDSAEPEVLWTTNKKMSESSIYKKHLGEINLSIANKDIISYGHQTCSLPSYDELANKFVSFDSEPLITPAPFPTFEPVKVPNKYRRITSILNKINQLVFTKTDEEAANKDNKLFFFNDGCCSYLGSHIKYHYNGPNLLDICGAEYDKSQQYYGIVFKYELISQNEKCNIPKYDPEDLSDIPWEQLPDSFLEDYASLQYFSKLFMLNSSGHTVTLLLGPKVLYYPIDYFMKLHSEGSKNQPVMLTPLFFRCKTLSKTHICEFQYSIQLGEIDLTITQQASFVNLDGAKSNVDIDFYNKLMKIDDELYSEDDNLDEDEEDDDE